MGLAPDSIRRLEQSEPIVSLAGLLSVVRWWSYNTQPSRYPTYHRSSIIAYAATRTNAAVNPAPHNTMALSFVPR
jgi:hypothetical protein